MSVTKFDQLPFVRVHANGDIQSTWDVEKHRTEDHAKDCEIGRKFCMATIMLIAMTGNPLYLSRVIQGQVRAGKWEAIEIGFAQQLSEEVST